MSKSRLTKYFRDSWLHLVTDYREFREGPQTKEQMLYGFRHMSLPAFGYYFMLAVSTVIATLGLIANSAATIIGAMIISPLMNPIMSLAYGITTRNRQLIDRGCLMLATGIPLVVLVSYVSSQIVGIRAIGGEVLSRAHPSYLDLGVAIGSGVAAAFAYSRQSIASTLPGVAIAVALVPPLCVVGIGLQAGALGAFMAANAGIDEFMSIGALNLFLTNLWGILFASIIVFVLQKYGRWRQVLVGLSISAVMLLLLTQALGEGFYKMYIRELFYNELLRYRTEENRFAKLEVHSIDIRFLRNKYRVQLTLFANVHKLDPEEMKEAQRKLDNISHRLQRRLEHPLLIELNVIPMYYLRSDRDDVSAEGTPPSD